MSASSSERPSVIVVCQISFGFGHWMRTAVLLEALRHRFDVTLILGGRFSPEMVIPEGVHAVHLPAKIRNADNQIVGLDPDLDPVALNQERARMVADVAKAVRPAAVIVEYFPFGRVEIATEVRSLIETLRYPVFGMRIERPVVLCSLRDIRQHDRPHALHFDLCALERANYSFDGVLVHADPRFARFEETCHLAHLLRIPVHYTGFVVPEDRELSTPCPREPVVLVSAGGGLGGETLLRAAIEAQRRTDLAADFAMRMLLGAFQPEPICRELAEAARGVDRLELIRWVPNLRRELTRAAVSVSRCGYNTSMDLVRTRTPSLVVPFTGPYEDEQTSRAHKLAAMGAWRVLDEQHLTPETLAQEIRRTAAFVPAPIDLDVGGARATTELLVELVRQNRAKQTNQA